jgi:uncharacterized protein YbaP (TraB family)
MELDMDDLDAPAIQALANELGLIKGDGTLESLLGPAAYAEALKFANETDIPLQILHHAEPWYAAITVEQLMLARLGFDSAFGIETHLANRAIEDHKEILGLETIDDQLTMLDNLSADAQRSLFLQSLGESRDMSRIMDGLVRAWRHGDVAFLEDNLLDEMRQYPELYQALVVNRNQAWVAQINRMLTHADDYLIIVGALHLIGDDGVPAVLQKLGRKPVQMTQTADR